MNTQEALVELEQDLRGNRSFADLLLEATKAGFEHLKQQIYTDFASHLNALSDTRAGAQLNPDGKPYFGQRLNGDDVYIQRRGNETPQLLIESDYPNRKVQTYYWVTPSEDDHTKLEGFKHEVHTYTYAHGKSEKREIIDTPNEKLSISMARQHTRLMRKMNQNYNEGARLSPYTGEPIKRSGSFMKRRTLREL